jgi:hypothetical protein
VKTPQKDKACREKARNSGRGYARNPINVRLSFFDTITKIGFLPLKIEWVREISVIQKKNHI